ncbi:MAG: cysteine desulfurase [Saprospiraceae bacterium]|nr:cysteine desulfurase [Saprospiraceae bacterium]MCF8251944.1 cysteine desulfurase [Saprospiraceae bacterium]MCF8281644.1 cysteine desulfurase [Bacteroidales bacterium]MCF8313600.1 cysteine desulfurase [Saprospiraceae bacterium]MCF8442328.1 cysteine desulfurase [Saprospiraceae bacterium]
MRIYLDNAATTPLLPEVIEAMSGVMREHYGNPSSIHAEGRAMRAVIEESRKTVAKLIGASIGEIFFTSGGTESSNMALKCAVRDLGVQRIISSPTEHHCVSHPLEILEHQGVKLEMLRVDEKGRLDYEQLEELLQSDQSGRTLVSLMHANNEIGTMSDMERISRLCENYGALYHSDTVQTMGHFPFDVSKIKIHFLTGGAHKFHGPKGVGFIYINHEAKLKPFIDGGGQERNMRGGTENAYGIVGMAKALSLACGNMAERRGYIEDLRQYLIEQLLENFEDIQFNGDIEGNNLYTVLSVSFPASAKSELLLLQLDIAGVSASGGSACSSGAEVGSHVLAAIGADPGRKTIRFSFSHLNTKDEIEVLVGKLKTIVELRKMEAVA